MKKIIVFLVVLAFTAGLAGAIYGRTMDEEIKAVRNYLDVLDAKLAQAKKNKQFARVNLLHANKVVALALVTEEGAPIVARSESEPATVIIVTPPALPLTGAIPPVSDILYWIVFGLIVGGTVNFVVNGSRRGIIGSIFLGILGALVGGYFGKMFLNVGVTGFNIPSFILAIAGALVVVVLDWILRSKNI